MSLFFHKGLEFPSPLFTIFWESFPLSYSQYYPAKDGILMWDFWKTQSLVLKLSSMHDYAKVNSECKEICTRLVYIKSYVSIEYIFISGRILCSLSAEQTGKALLKLISRHPNYYNYPRSGDADTFLKWEVWKLISFCTTQLSLWSKCVRACVCVRERKRREGGRAVGREGGERELCLLKVKALCICSEVLFTEMNKYEWGHGLG